jgi:hypothetical protein
MAFGSPFSSFFSFYFYRLLFSPLGKPIKISFYLPTRAPFGFAKNRKRAMALALNFL